MAYTLKLGLLKRVMTEGFLKPNAKTAFFKAILKFCTANQLYTSKWYNFTKGTHTLRKIGITWMYIKLKCCYDGRAQMTVTRWPSGIQRLSLEL